MTTESPESLDWSQGCWRNLNAEPAAARIVVAADWAPIRAFAEPLTVAPELVYGDLLPVLRQADLRLVNLESVLSDRGAPVWKSGSVFKGERRHLSGLQVVPFDAVTLANNHVLDYGVEAFGDMLNLLDRHHIGRTGAGLTPEEAHRRLDLRVGGLTLAVVNFSEAEDLTEAREGPGVFGWEVDRVVEEIRQARAEVDAVLVVVHCGLEYIPFPPPYVAAACRAAAEAGADLVVGHHPHVPQGIEFHCGVPICYSLGNFVFYQETGLAYRKVGYLVKAGFAAGGLVDLELIPYAIGSDRLSLLLGERRAWFFDRLRAVSEPLSRPDGADQAWHGFLRHYGQQGLADEVTMILGRLRDEPRKGAAMFRNRLTTQQHYWHWRDLLTRVVDGTLDTGPEWARALAEEWLTTSL
ncbi:MAG: CapA family protein [Candidatus Latescibacterota bacterium]|jgi:poly-gamma-glutamate synthesis protein (capsule biosynthesis protein)